MSGVVQQVKIDKAEYIYQSCFTEKSLDRSENAVNNIGLYTDDTVDIKTEGNNILYKNSLTQNIVNSKNTNNITLNNVLDYVNSNSIANSNNVSTSNAAGVVFNGSLLTVNFDKKWEVGLKEEEINLLPQVFDGVLYVRTKSVKNNNGFLSAFDTVTGKNLWKFKTKGELVSLLHFHNGMVYAGSLQAVYILDAKTGKELGMTKLDGRTEAPPVFSDDKIYVATPHGFMYVMEIGGKKDVSIQGMMFLGCYSLAYNDGKIYAGGGVGDYSATFAALDGVSGNRLWQLEIPGSITTSPHVQDGKVYLGSRFGNMYNSLHSFNANDGKHVWEYKAGKPFFSSPVLYNKTVYARTTDGNLHALNDNNGMQMWKFSANGNNVVTPPPSAMDGVIYIGDKNGTVHALDADRGNKVGEFQNNNSFSFLCADKNMVYAATSGGKVYALKSNISKVSDQIHSAESVELDDSQLETSEPKIIINGDWAIIGNTPVPVNR